ncbi:MAG: CHAT domain-containing protein [Vicinamibacterales bacterium]
MPDSSRSTLSLRIRAATTDSPEVYPVDATIDGSGSLTAFATIDAKKLAALESDRWAYGRRLGQVLFADDSLQRALAYARGSATHVSVSLEIDPEAAALHDLMWEHLIYVAGGEELAFAASDTIAFSRRIPLEIPTVPPSEGPFRMLLVISSPVELDGLPADAPMQPIDVKKEIESLRSAWDALVQAGLMRVSVLGRMPPDLAGQLENAGYTVLAGAATLDALADGLALVDSLHLISHGTFKHDQASLLLENAAGNAEEVSEANFLGKFGERSLRLAFLQACKSASRTPGVPNVMSGLAPKLARHAAGVVAMQDFVRVEDARRFAQRFYNTLLSTGLGDVAANAGRRGLYRPDSRNWAIPALYLTPKAELLWEPDAVLRAVQDLAEQFGRKSDVTRPFPVDVVRQTPGVSSKMETSPPGPRVRVAEAVASALFPADGAERRSPIVVIAGNYGRAKTAQLHVLYVDYAKQASRSGIVPFFVQISDFQSIEDSPEQTLALAIATTYRRLGIEVRAEALARRLKQKVILCIDGDQEADVRRRATAFDCLQAIALANPEASSVMTLDEQQIAQTPALQSTDSERQVPVLIVQLLSPATVAQYLNGLGDEYKVLLGSLRRANLFDLAGVPWLLSHLIRHANRGGLSRSGVIERIIAGNVAAANVPPGVWRIVKDLFGRMAWTLQTRQALRFDAGRVYEILDQVRGRREVQLEQLKAHALETKIVAAIDEDGIRFSYPGFQSYWCAQYLVDSGTNLPSHLDDITATLGRRSRVRHWEDTLVLMAGMMDAPERLIDRILAGSSMSYGEQAFLAARCIHEARLARRGVSQRLVDQVLDSLVWRSTPMKESSASVRVAATECLALLKEPASLPHLVSLVIGRVRPTASGEPTFELSGLRHAALQVLLTMQEEVDADSTTFAVGASAAPSQVAIKHVIELWRSGDLQALRDLFSSTTIAGLPAVIAFVLGTSGGNDNLTFLTDALLAPGTAEDAQWSIIDSLLFFDPGEVTRRSVTKLREKPALHAQAAYIIGRLRVAGPGSDEAQFLVACLKSDTVETRGMALKSLAQLGVTTYRRHCERIATGAWDRLARDKDLPQDLLLPKKAEERARLRAYALESLRLIGDESSLTALREARNWRPSGSPADRQGSQLMQLSYEVSEDVYWRLTGGRDGDFYDASERPVGPR